MEEFWDWKRSDVIFKFQSAKYSWDEFCTVWDSVKEKTNEMPEKGTPSFTDYYFWKTSKPQICASHPGESTIKHYYDDLIAPKRRALGLPV